MPNGGEASRRRLELVVAMRYKREKWKSTEGHLMNAVRPDRRRHARGFTLIEVLVILGIIGIFMVVSYPSVLNIMEVRNLENTAREVQTSLQQAKLRAVDTKINHRVRFFQPAGATYWAYEVERAQANLTSTPATVTWTRVPGSSTKVISNRYAVTISLPVDGSDPVAEFSPVGAMANFTVNQNTILIRSPKLTASNQMDERIVSLFLGGSIHYDKRRSS
jgi:prepilin-type N-terminal cleavage/methylation domain-containing protein